MSPRHHPGSLRESRFVILEKDQRSQYFEHLESSLISEWLALMCKMLPGVRRGVVLGDDPLTALACWPAPDIDTRDLISAAQLAASRQATTVCAQSESGPDGRASMLAAHPLKLPGRQQGVIALELDARTSQQPVVLRLLDWGQAWLELLQHSSPVQREPGAVSITDLLEETLRQRGAADSASALASTVAKEMGFERVCIGLLCRGKIRLAGISYNAAIDPRTDLFHKIEAGIRETLARQETILSSDATPDSNPALIALRSMEQCDSVLSLPLFSQDTPAGVMLCLQRHRSPSPATIGQCESLARFSGPLLQARMSEQQPLTARLVDSLRARPRAAKAGLAIVMTALTLLSLVQGEYRITASANLEGRIQRAIVAPVDGYLLRAPLRAGASIVKGQLLAELDDRELRLEYHRWQSQREEYTRQYNRELADLNHAQMRIYQAQIAQADAQIQLQEDRLQRVKIRAPMDGVIIKGDLSRSLGAPVERGEVLFELAPLNEYRLVLDVEETDITHTQSGQRGTLSLSSLPQEKIPFTVERVAPIYQEKEGKITYRVEARLDSEHHDLRPGMGGYGKIDIGERCYLWIWSHKLVNWLRLQLWSLGP